MARRSTSPTQRGQARSRLDWRLIGRAAAPAAALLVIGYFALSAIVGPNGILSFGDYRRQVVKREAELKQVEVERARLVHRKDLLDPGRGADPDYVDELVRARTGQLREDEVILTR